MYLELVGVWLTGPVPNQIPAVDAPSVPVFARTPTPIDWPSNEDGVISFRLIDNLGQPVVLTLTGGDSIKMLIGFDFRSGAQVTIAGTAGSGPGQYLFTVAANTLRSLNGPNVYEVRAVKGAATQQVAPPGYFTIKQSLAT